MQHFDPDDNARAMLKERVAWMLYLGGLFFLLYGSANRFAALHAPHPSLMMEWERGIPFVDWMIVPYMSSDLIFCLAFLLPYTRSELRVLAARVLVILAVSVAMFVLVPFQCGMDRPEPSCCIFLFRLLQADRPFNQFPSLHVAFAVVLWTSMRRYIRPWYFKMLLLAWFGLIVASTLLVYQHHFVDIPAGFAVGMLALRSIPQGKKSFLTRCFMAPRHLKMALYYLLAAAILLAWAFIAGTAGWLPAWVGISLLCVSIVYAFGLNTWPAGSNARPHWSRWLLYGPYFTGAYLSWCYYRRGLPLVARVDEGIYFGRLPAADEYAILQQYPIRIQLNLALEQQIGRSPLEEKRYALLDMTLQSPEILHGVVEEIDAHRDEGVFVHCALGLSRAVLAISAWMLSQGRERHEIHTLMRQLCPKHINAAYMQVSLDLYEAFLQEKKAREQPGPGTP